MKNNDLISVIIPTYNRSKLITKAIESVLNQTYKNLEVIVIDDCSIDNTEDVIKKINDKRLKYIKLDSNKGACYARNVGIKNAKGKYIAFQDSDDEFYPEKLEKQYNNLLKKKSDLDFCKILINDDTNIVLPTDQQEKRILDNNIFDELCNGNFISTQAIIVKKELIEKYLFDINMPRMQEFDLLLRMGQNTKFSYTNEVLVNLYTQKDSISKSPKKLEKAIYLFFNKDYKLSDEQKNNLTYYLLNLYGKYTEIYNDLYEKYNDLDKSYSNLLKSNTKLTDDYNTLTNEYNNIINSKRWKMMNKFCKIIRK